jgi:hypothetical protein
MKKETKLRKSLYRQGFLLRKRRINNSIPLNDVGYRIIDANTNSIAAGEHFDLSLEDVDNFTNYK